MTQTNKLLASRRGIPLAVVFLIIVVLSMPVSVNAGIGDNSEDFIDAVSNLHAPTDIGTHSAFAEMQDKNGVWDTLTESDEGTAGNNVETFVNVQPNLHAETDIGTHSLWTELNDKDTTYDTLTEANTGSAGGSEWLNVNAFDSTWDAFDITAGDSPWLGAQDQPTHMRGEMASGDVQLGWFDFPSTSLSGSITVNISCYTANSDGVGDDWLDVYVDYTGSGAGADVGDVGQHTSWSYDTIVLGSHSVAEVNALRVHFQYKKSGGGDDVWIDHCRIGLNVAGGDVYDLDLEVGWNNADFDETSGEEICIFASTQGSEALRVDVWTGSWTNVFTDIAVGWNNISVASWLTDATFEMRFTDTSNDAVEADTWLIDCVLLHCWTDAVADYDMDLEVCWNAADFDETSGEELCIFGGSQGSEALRVDVWGGSWINVITDLAVGWNNVSVSSYLTDATFEIRFTDTTSDTVEADTWQVEGVLLHVWTTNFAPVNDQMPTLDNADDTDNIYAQYKEYQMTVYVSDQNGFGDVDYLEVGLWDNTRTTEYWRFRYDEDTDIFSEEYDIGTVVSLNVGGSTATETGNDIDATFYFTIDWDHADLTDSDIKCYVVDTLTLSDTDWYEANFDIETRLDYSVAPSVISDDSGTVDRGDLDESFLLGGTLIYYTSVDDAPPSAQVDVWVSASEYGTNVGPWSDLVLTAGAFEITCYADNLVGLDTYTIKPVIESSGSGGASLYHTTDLTDTYIADLITVQTTTADDANVDMGSNTEIRVTLLLAYDNQYLASGDTVTLDDVGMAWDAVNVWFDLTRTQSSVGSWKYFVNSSSETEHGITGLNLNTQEQAVIWNRIKILTTTTDDDNINYNTQAIIAVTAETEYEGHALGSGDALYMNDTLMTWNGTYFVLNPQFAQVGSWLFFVNSSSANEATYGITIISLNAQQASQIWNRLIIDIQANDETPLNNVEVTFTLTVTFEYDSSSCTTYQIAINRNSAWWLSFTNANKSLFVDTNADVEYPYTANSVTAETAEGITVFTCNTETVTWAAAGNNAPINDTEPTCSNLDDTDNLYAMLKQYSIVVYVSDAQGFADIDYLEISLYSDDQLTLYWTVRYDEDTNTFSEQYDPNNYITLDIGGSSAIESGIDIDATFLITINWNHPDFADGDFKAYVVDDEPTSDTDWFQDVGGWDYETRLDYSVAPSVASDDSGAVDRGDLDESFIINGSIIYYGGTVNPLSAQVDVWISASEYGTNVGPWSDLVLTAGVFSVSCYADNLVGLDTYTIKIVIEGAGSSGVTLYHTTDLTDTYIADLITVQTTTVSDSHVNINNNIEICVTLMLAYDSEVVGSGDSVTMNDTAMTWDAVNGWWDLTRVQASVGEWSYFVNSSSESGYGITGLNLNSQEVAVIWNSLTISLTNPTTQRINVGANASGMIVTITYDYDSTSYSGTFNMNDTDFAHSVFGKYGYAVESVNGDDTYGITTISSNPDETYCIFDSLSGYITPPDEADQHININTNASGMAVWALYDYDGTTFDGVLGLNDADYAHSVAGNYSYYTASASADTYGITAFSSYNQTWCIFDRLIVSIVADDETPNNDIQVNFTLTVSFDFDDASCTTYNLTIERSLVLWHAFTHSNKSLFNDTASGATYTYAVKLIISESLYNITTESSITATVVWSKATEETEGGSGGIPHTVIPTTPPEAKPSAWTIFVTTYGFIGIGTVLLLIGAFVIIKVGMFKTDETAGGFLGYLSDKAGRLRLPDTIGGILGSLSDSIMEAYDKLREVFG